jgi:hypothetical protein
MNQRVFSPLSLNQRDSTESAIDALEQVPHVLLQQRSINDLRGVLLASSRPTLTHL